MRPSNRPIEEAMLLMLLMGWYLAFLQIVKSAETFLVKRNRVTDILNNLFQCRSESRVESVIQIRFQSQGLFKQSKLLFIFHFRDGVKHPLSSFDRLEGT